MTIPEMESSALELRKAEIAEAVKTPEADLDALEKEAREIAEELEKRAKAAAEAEKRRAEIAAGKKPEKEIKNFKEDRKMYSVDSVEYRDAWVHELQGRLSEEEIRGGYTQGSTYATNAIPTEVADRFFEKAKKLAPMLNEITLFRVAGDLKFVAEGTRQAASAHTENATMTVQGDTTVAVTLGAIEYAKIIGISKSAMRMSVPEFINWLEDYLFEDIIRAIDNAVINAASNGIASITWTSGTNAVYASTYGYATIISAIALLPAADDANAKFLTNKATLWGKIASIVDSAGRPIFIQNAENGFAGKILGYPVLVDDYVATSKGDVYLGNFRNVVGNLSEGPVVERSEASGFRDGTIDFRGYASFDSKPAVTGSFIRIATTA